MLGLSRAVSAGPPRHEHAARHRPTGPASRMRGAQPGRKRQQTPPTCAPAPGVCATYAPF
eukprot:6819585-Prymnesium_polylepis.3